MAGHSQDEADLDISRRWRLPFGRRLAAGPLRSVSRRRPFERLIVPALVAVAVVSALAIPSFVGRKPVLTAAAQPEVKRIEPRPVAVVPIARPAPGQPPAAMPPVRTAVAVDPSKPAAPATTPSVVSPPATPLAVPPPARTAARPAPPPLSLDMLPVLAGDPAVSEVEAAKPPARKGPVQRPAVP
ncbi:hypothetical protein ASG40_13710 [Methylobacterium sp. Leaf399]|uniref:hypothetical protein n=1 Tax=Methylobacterium sp. Leaf399 TaxID=1736364 RepID=UPI0006F33E32|nr:hypothetical protein [Methylobacterium sp. Leaf399]KQT07392.1 hypothetical protein ASG40_13710 [Methylobacterium sp. Leaf399]